MPLYEYACSACEANFDHLVRSADDERNVRCPECGGQKVERRMSVVAAPRSGEKAALPMARRGGGCGRCGDPEGPCGM